MENSYFVGDDVYIYSTSLDEVIEGKIEGFEENRTRVKVLQYVLGESIRHLVSVAYVFSNEEDAIKAKLDHQVYEIQNDIIDYRAGYTVNLHNGSDLVKDRNGDPLLYQIIAVYPSTKRVSLVTSYGEHIGTYDISNIRYVSNIPIFKKEDYELNSTVIWISGEDVYEGKIIVLHETQAELCDIKKLYPVNYVKRVPYYKLSNSQENSTSSIIHTIIGDTL